MRLLNEQYFYLMLKFRRNRLKTTSICRTMPDELFIPQERTSLGQEAKKKLEEISYTDDLDIENMRYEDWSKNQESIFREESKKQKEQQGCFEMNLRKIHHNTTPIERNLMFLRKKELERQLQFKKTLLMMKKEQKRKKSCASVNFIFEKVPKDRRIHSNGFNQYKTEPKPQLSNALIFTKAAISIEKELSKMVSTHNKLEKINDEKKTVRLQRKHQRNHTVMIMHKKRKEHSTLGKISAIRQVVTIKDPIFIFQKSPYKQDFIFLNTVLKSERRNHFCPPKIKMSTPQMERRGKSSL